MQRAWRLLAVPAALTLLGLPAHSQEAISAKSGLIHYVDGRVLLDGQPVEPKFGRFPQMKEGSLLRTQAGRAELLLSPGVFLRMGENGELRLVSDRLSDTRLELLSGAILIECAEMIKGNALTVTFRDAAIAIRQDGLYQIDAETAELKVYDGEAAVESGAQALRIKRGKALALEGTLAMRKFDTRSGDALYRWGKRRAEYIALANLSSAKSLYDSGARLRASAWYWNPYFGMFTYIPYRGILSSPFGWRYYSPREVYVIYAPPRRAAVNAWDSTPRHNADLGYATIAPTPAGRSGTMAASPAPTTASGAPSAPIPRESGSGGGRSR
jgi:hypothetical protein